MSDKFVTNDKGLLEPGGKAHDADVAAMTGRGGYIEIKTVEQVRALAEAAKRTYDTFDESIKSKMTAERAARVRALRVDGHSWRALADVCHEEWGPDADWSPPSNQIAGMVLCRISAETLGEDAAAEPWN